MADWPDADEVKQVLDITSTDWDDTIDRVVAAAIAQVKHDVGHWDEYEDEPDDSLSQAALRLAELIGLRPELAADVGSRDPTYLRLLRGHRRVFGIA
ncbi:MAG TPA: hypothetical protein VNN79_24950 [Actinomycetota bacterium]|nr:hypothetical protein [Actinomycetota bacterium]